MNTAVSELAQAAPPLSARSVALSMLLGTVPPRMTARQLTMLGEHFGISASTMRVALSRMTAAGELVPTEQGYTLSPRHLERQAQTDALIAPVFRRHDGTWRMVVVVDRGRSAAQRTTLRTTMLRNRFAELREGVWLRPNNLERIDYPHSEEVRALLTLPENERELCLELWNLGEWAATANGLLAILFSDAAPMDRLAAAAAAVRHLRTDPALPPELEPEGWPAGELRRCYGEYRRELATLVPDSR